MKVLDRDTFASLGGHKALDAFVNKAVKQGVACRIQAPPERPIVGSTVRNLHGPQRNLTGETIRDRLFSRAVAMWQTKPGDQYYAG